MASSVSALRSPRAHSHTIGTNCPICEQPIPNEKADQVRKRIEERERQVSDAVAVRLREQFAGERAQIEGNARALVEQAKREGTAALEFAKADGDRRETVALTAAQEQIDAFKTDAAAQEAAIREEARCQIDTLAQANADLTASVAEREASARADGERAAQAQAKERIDALQRAGETRDAAAREEIERLKQASADVHTAATAKVEQAEQAKEMIEAAANGRVAAAEQAKIVAENEAKVLKENQQTVLNERLQEQREALEKDKTTALNAKDANHFKENQKLKDKLEEVQRKLEKKTADEIGEGGEVDLFEELKAEFEGDRLRRVPKGTPGADIIHEIWEEGRLCGKIVYDSKKRQSWKTEYATKLCEDKVAEGADHAVLALMKFPADCRQLDVREGVILANPSRVLALAEILRDQIVSMYGLRLSNEEREKKTNDLYAYITSERYRQHLDAMEQHTDKLADIDVAEQKTHKSVWENRGATIKALEKARGNLRADVARIIGTRDAAE